MLYKLKILASNTFLGKRITNKLNKITGRDNEALSKTLIKKYVPRKSFADVGALWGVDGFYSYLAEEHGATKIVAIDIYPASEKFLEEKKKRNSAVEFIEGDINLLETSEKIGTCDVVFCSGVLYHTPDPIHQLTRLRAICRETLILNTSSIPEIPGIKNVSVFYPFLGKNQRKIWDRGIGSQKAITGPYEPESGYGNWFWGMTPSCIESMLNCVGFEVKERHITQFNSTFVCQAVEIKFTASSGEWNTPKDDKFLKFRR